VGRGNSLAPPDEHSLPGEVAGHPATADHAGPVKGTAEEAETGPGKQRPVKIKHRQTTIVVREPRGTSRRAGYGDLVSRDEGPGAHESMMRGAAVRFVNTEGGGR
jgi:hypothetical protein